MKGYPLDDAAGGAAMTASVEIPEPIYTFYARRRGKCDGGCGIQIQIGDLVTRRRDEFRCKTCAERWK